MNEVIMQVNSAWVSAMGGLAGLFVGIFVIFMIEEAKYRKFRKEVEKEYEHHLSNTMADLIGDSFNKSYKERKNRKQNDNCKS